MRRGSPLPYSDAYFEEKIQSCDGRINRLERKVDTLNAKRRQSKPTEAAETTRTILPKEKIERSVERLSRPAAPKAALPEIDNAHPRRRMKKMLRPQAAASESDEEVDVDALVERLAVTDVEDRDSRRQEQLDAVSETWPENAWRDLVASIHKADDGDDEDEDLCTLSEERQEALGARLSTEALERRRKMVADLSEVYAVRQTIGLKGPVHEEDVAARLHDASRTHRDATMKALYDKYMPAIGGFAAGGRRKRQEKLSQEEVQAMAARLSSPKKR